MSPIDTVLQRLDAPGSRLRRRTGDQWSCRCPAHDDKGPSLSVRELSDGRVLLHCFSGCQVEEIVAALGLDVGDLFPPRAEAFGSGPARVERRRLLTAGQALDLLHSESIVVFLCAVDLAKGEALDEATKQRLAQAAARIGMLREEVSV